ncbi:MAG: tetratricopeptide repeat protein [Planctomycetes bacterium]|nr:tetratricopeptide repeat protein [Planctomycetota bacterium]
MSRRSLLIPLIVALTTGLLLDGTALAQRRGSTSGGSSASSAGRSSSGGGRSSGGVSGGSRSSAGSSAGRSGGSFGGSTSGRSSSRPSVSPPSRPSTGSTSGSTFGSRSTGLSGTGSSSTGVTPRRTSGTVYGSSGSSTSGSPTTRSLPTRSTTPTRTDLTPSGSTSSRGESRSTSGYTRDTSGGFRGDSRSGYTRDSSGGYTGGTRLDSTRRPSTLGPDSVGGRAPVVDLAPAPARRSSSSTVPSLYGSASGREVPARAGTPTGERRLALSARLEAATSPVKSGGKLEPASLAERYTPGARPERTRANVARAELQKSKGSSAEPQKPGATRRDALTPRERERARAAAAKKAKEAKQQKDAAGNDPAALRKRYNAAKQKDRALQHRMDLAAKGAAQASDLATRAALAANPLTYGVSGYAAGGSATCVDDPWSGYCGGQWPGGSSYHWYWNQCFPGWWSWWVGCTNWWYPCYGWNWSWSVSWHHGWGWGFGWHHYSPYSYASRCWWPTYAYCTPSTLYSYVEVPVYVEKVVEVEPAVVAAPAALPAAPTDLGHRASAEYMALGDRAFVEGRYGDAVHYYAKAIEYAPEDGVLYLALSDALFATGDYHYAAYALREALRESPELASLGIDKRGFYGVAGDFERQLTVLESYQKDHALDEDARLVLAANYLFSLDHERCLALLDHPLSEAVRGTQSGELLAAAALGALATE